MRKDEFGKIAEVHRRESWIEGPDKVLVEPLCFFDLEAYSFDGS